MLSAFFKGKRAFVTGHTGFKGSWLSLWLSRLGAKVTGYALPPETEPNLFTLAKLGRVVRHVEGDVRDWERLYTTLHDAEPDLVFHLAAQPLVRRSHREPKATFDVNVGGTTNILEAVRLTPSVRSVVIITTDKCYENREWVWGYRENDPLGGNDPYSASKAAAELVVAAYNASYFGRQDERKLGLASARAGNVIGGGDWAEDRIIPDAVRAIRAGTALELRNPRALRPWQHVLDPVAGYLILSSCLWDDPGRYAGAWNFGPSHLALLTVSELVSQFIREMGKGEWRDVSAFHKGPAEAERLWLSCDKAIARLRWNPVLEVQQAVATTAAWYRDVISDRVDAARRCELDIEAFVERARVQSQWWAS